MSLWCDFETVIAPYYVWPTIAIALLGLSRTGPWRSVRTLSFAAVADIASNAELHAEWVWWVIVLALGTLLAVSWPSRVVVGPEELSPELAEQRVVAPLIL